MSVTLMHLNIYEQPYDKWYFTSFYIHVILPSFTRFAENLFQQSIVFRHWLTFIWMDDESVTFFFSSPKHSNIIKNVRNKLKVLV